MSRRAFAIIATLALLVMFVSVNLIAARSLKGARLDLTGDRLYSLSVGTRTILRGLNEPVELKLYWSREAAADRPALRAYAGRVREFLQMYAARSRDMVRIVEVDPQRFTDAEDEAVRAGLEPIAQSIGGDPIYLGIVGANAVDERVVAPALLPEREPFLEYDLTRIVAELENPQRLSIALVTSLPIGETQPPTWLTELRRVARVQIAPAEFTELPKDADILVVVHPPSLNESQAVAIDQFVMAKGRAFFAVDPAAVLSSGVAPPISEFSQIFSAWGIVVSPDVVLDRAGALPLAAGAPPHPLFVEASRARVDRRDLMTSGLRRSMNFLAAGTVNWTPQPGIDVTPLVRTSNDIMQVPAAIAAAAPQPQDLLAGWKPTGSSAALAVRVSGVLPSAFFSTAPLKQASRRAEVVVVGDADFLEDRVYVDPQSGPARDNASFVLNALDVMAGSDELVTLRSRAPSERRLSALDDAGRSALASQRAERARLEADLAVAVARLAQLRATRSPDVEPALTEIAETERLQSRAEDARSALRAIERSAQEVVAQRERLVVFANVWVPPFLIAAAGLLVFWMRMRRTERMARRST
jgi:ABC-type uncharacterized transport system involved in gliding motility auxiliary subunit